VCRIVEIDKGRRTCGDLNIVETNEEKREKARKGIRTDGRTYTLVDTARMLVVQLVLETLLLLNTF